VKVTHGVDHWDPDGCFGCKLRSLQFNDGPAPQTLMERGWDKDMPAYARLRSDGIQPRHIDGSAELEARLSEGQMEADMRHLFDEDKGFTKKDLPRLAEGMAEAQASGWSPVA
jgi:hypothetical protein